MTFKDFAVSLVILTVLSILAVGWWNGKLSPTPRPSPSPVILSVSEESPGPTPRPTPQPTPSPSPTVGADAPGGPPAVILSVSEESPGPSTEPTVTYVLNLNTKKFHYPDCPSVEQIKPKNYEAFTGSREEVLARGFVPCKNCNP